MAAGWAIFLGLVILLVAGGIGYVVFSRIRAQRLGLPPPSWTSFFPWRKSSSSSDPYGGAPPPAPGGIVGWATDRIRLYRNRHSRTAAGAYEQPLFGGRAAGHRGFGPLDPDEAWDSRVGNEADPYGGYYERELEAGGRRTDVNSGSREADTSYGGGGAGNPLAGTPGHTPQDSSYHMNIATTAWPGGNIDDNGRGRTRSRSSGLMPGTRNPFGDDNERPAASNPFGNEAEASNMSLREVSPRPMVAAAGNSGKDGDSHAERRSMFREGV